MTLPTRQRRALKTGIYKYFTGISSRPVDQNSKKIETIFSRLDMMARDLPNSDADGENYIIRQALCLLQDMLHDDVPVDPFFVNDGFKELASQFRSDVVEANSMFDEEQQSINDNIIPRIKNYVSGRYKNMPNPNDLETLCLVARFNNVDKTIKPEAEMLVTSQQNQRNYTDFGMKRLKQLETFYKWMKSQECKTACGLYKILRRHKLQDNIKIPMSVTVGLHG